MQSFYTSSQQNLINLLLFQFIFSPGEAVYPGTVPVTAQLNAGTNLAKHREVVQQGKQNDWLNVGNKIFMLILETFIEIFQSPHFNSFGVCCVFVYEQSGSTLSQNCSYIRNPNYPNGYTDTSSLQYNVVKCDPSTLVILLLRASF